jgi:hypothetical protein
MSGIKVDPENIWHGGRKLIEMSEDIETSTSGILSVPSPSESSAGVESERSFIRAWDDLKYLEIRVIRMLVENLDDLGSKLKEQADRYETADAETVEEINNIDFEEYRGELIERESYRIDLDNRTADGGTIIGTDEQGNQITVY